MIAQVSRDHRAMTMCCIKLEKKQQIITFHMVLILTNTIDMTSLAVHNKEDAKYQTLNADNKATTLIGFLE